MISGIGTDIIEVARVAEKMQRHSGFREYVFSPAEIAYCEKMTGKYEYYAARFAAKEAFSKALGTGIGAHCALHDLSVINNELGAPEIIVSEKLQTLLNQRQIRKIHLSISHTDTIATAIVILS